MKVAVNPPRTPVTKGSSGIAAATVPNVCKMPGPPAPFVPTPLPNIAQSSDLDKGTKKVKFEGKEVGIKGATFKSSKGDEASKGTGGGLVSSCTSGAAKFVAPGSMDVKAEGKNIHLLTDAMTNNNGGTANAATMPGVLQAGASPGMIKDWLEELAKACNDKVNTDEGFTKNKPPKGKVCRSLGTKKHKCCEDAIKDPDQNKNKSVKSEQAYERNGSPSQKSFAKALNAGIKAKQKARAGGASPAAARAAFGAAFGPKVPPIMLDVVVLDNNSGQRSPSRVKKVYDFKFNCGKKGKMSKAQKKKYQKAMGQSPVIIHASW